MTGVANGGIMEDGSHREFLLARLRQASLQAKLIEAELTAIGVALKGNIISPEGAVVWIREAGLWWMVLPMPTEVAALAPPTEPAEKST